MSEPFIFISYSRQDSDFMQHLRDQLEAVPFLTWVDKKIPAGAKWWSTIEDKIKDCGAFIVIVSPNSTKSTFVEREVHLAEKLGKPIIPIRLAGDPWSLLANIQHEDATNGLSYVIQNSLIEELNDVLGKQPIDLIVKQGNLVDANTDLIGIKFLNLSYRGEDKEIARLIEQTGTPFPHLMRRGLGYWNDWQAIPRTYWHGGPYKTDGATHADIIWVGLRLGQESKANYEHVYYLAKGALARTRDIYPKHQPVSLAMALPDPSHGVNLESCMKWQQNGYIDAIKEGLCSPSLRKITIVEPDAERFEALGEMLGVGHPQYQGAFNFERIPDGNSFYWKMTIDDHLKK